jgi:hypothetical protein
MGNTAWNPPITWVDCDHFDTDSNDLLLVNKH